MQKGMLRPFLPLRFPKVPSIGAFRSAVDGAGLPVAGLTAHSAGVKLDASGPRSNIVITAASGGVGLYVVQLAKHGKKESLSSLVLVS
ncbi:hypothetical protein ACET3Z_013183 [Daucus carota]